MSTRDANKHAAHQAGTIPSRLGIGTVQFGLTYGINNRLGQVPYRDVCIILEKAMEAGVNFLDTARQDNPLASRGNSSTARDRLPGRQSACRVCRAARRRQKTVMGPEAVFRPAGGKGSEKNERALPIQEAL